MVATNKGKASVLKRVCGIVAIIGVLTIVVIGGKYLLSEIKYESQFDQSFVSPNGINTILVRYDYMSRPTVFLNGKDTKIFEYSDPGFMENIHFDVEWKGDYEFVLYNIYVDEYYVIIIPQK